MKADPVLIAQFKQAVEVSASGDSDAHEAADNVIIIYTSFCTLSENAYLSSWPRYAQSAAMWEKKMRRFLATHKYRDLV